MGRWLDRRRATAEKTTNSWHDFQKSSTFWLAVIGTLTGVSSVVFNVWEHTHVLEKAEVMVSRIDFDPRKPTQPRITLLFTNGGNQNIAVERIELGIHAGRYSGKWLFTESMDSADHALPMLLLPGQMRILRVETTAPSDIEQKGLPHDLFYRATITSIDSIGVPLELNVDIGQMHLYDLKATMQSAEKMVPLPARADYGLGKSHVLVFEHLPRYAYLGGSLFLLPNCTWLTRLFRQSCGAAFGAFPDNYDGDDGVLQLCSATDNEHFSCPADNASPDVMLLVPMSREEGAHNQSGK